MEKYKCKMVEFQTTLHNKWKVEITPENCDQEPTEEEPAYNCEFSLFVMNGHDWEFVVRGQVKNTGCMDIGYGDNIIIHFCGRKDCEIFQFIYDKSKEVGKW